MNGIANTGAVMAVLSALYESGRVADLLVGLVALEALGLAWWHRHAGGRGLPWGLLLTLATGAALVLALGAALKGAPWPVIGLWLILALIGHLADLWVRRPGRGRKARPADRR